MDVGRRPSWDALSNDLGCRTRNDVNEVTMESRRQRMTLVLTMGLAILLAFPVAAQQPDDEKRPEPRMHEENRCQRVPGAA